MSQRGTAFKKDELKAAIVNSYAIKIDAAKSELERLQAYDIDRAMAVWREQCNDKITALAKKVADGSIEDSDYSTYDMFPNKPSAPVHWVLNDRKNDIERLELSMERRLSLLPAFAEDEKGNIVLTSYDFKRLGLD